MDKGMIEGFLIIGHVVSCMGVDIVSFEIVSIDKTIFLLMDILIAVVLKTLSIKVFSKSCV